MECTKGEWEKEGNKIKVSGRGTIAICPSPTTSEGVTEFIANAHLIAAAVNACIKLNPDNPQAVAESIGDMYEALRIILKDHTFSYDDVRYKEMVKALSKAGGK